MENQNPQISPTSPTQPQNIPVEQSQPIPNPINPPTSEPKSKFPLAVIIGIILFLLVAGSAAGFFVFKSQIEKPVAKPTPSPVAQQPIITPTPTPTADPTASWKTYVSPNGFSFKYPLNWSSSVQLGEEVILSSPEKDKMGDSTYRLAVSIIENPTTMPLQDFVKKNNYDLGGIAPFSKGPFSLNTSVDWVINRNAPGASANQEAMISHGLKVIELNCFACTDEMTNQFLSTFKFTDQAVTPLSIQDVAQIKQLLAIQDNTTVDKIVFTQDQQKYSNFSSGGFGQIGVGGGAKWFATKINNQWKIIFTGNGAIPSCSDIAQYNPPKDFLPCN